MPSFGKLKRFGIFTPAELRSLYGVPNWFDSDGYFLLPIPPDAFTSTDTFLGETGLTPTFTRLYYQGARRVIRGHEFKIIEGKVEIFYLLEHLASLCSATPYTPLLVRDWVRPERSDYASAIAASSEPMTPRQGIITDLALSKGLIGTARTYAFEGFGFKFQEQIARAI